MNSPEQSILGIIGGMIWASSLLYYKSINLSFNKKRGGQHSAPLLLRNLDFQPIVKAQAKNDWQQAGQILAHAAKQLEQAGCGAVMIASNTMHLVQDDVTAAVSVPLLNIFDCTAAAIKGSGRSRVGLLGTRYTMSNPFFIEQYKKRGIEVMVPADEDRVEVNRIIFEELIKNEVRPASRKLYEQVVANLSTAGAQGVILGCTEISLLLNQAGTVPLFDTTEIHAQMGVDWLLRNSCQ